MMNCHLGVALLSGCLEVFLSLVLGLGDLVVFGIFHGGRGGKEDSMETTEEASSRLEGWIFVDDDDGFVTIGSRTTSGNDEGHEEEAT
jgi:hypothetical protein